MSQMGSAINSEFEKLAVLTGEKLSKFDNKHFVGDGSYLHSSTYELGYNYGESSIFIKNELGHKDVGYIKVMIPVRVEGCQFKMKTRSQFSQFWNRKKIPFEILSSNTELTEWILVNEAFEKLCKRAKKDHFEPVIVGENVGNGFNINCTYHLFFNNYELVLEPFFDFFNGLVDFIRHSSSTTDE